MGISQPNLNKVTVRLARNKDEIRASQRLRYKVFYEEYKAVPDQTMAQERRDIDLFDDVADHLIVLDESHSALDDKIVGTYRLLQREAADRHGRFYTSNEYDIAPLLNSNTTLLELGRSCVLSEYRTRPVLQLLWQGIADYTLDHDIDLLFGCASLHGTDIRSFSQQLAYLHHYHLAPEGLRPRALRERYVAMDLHAKDELDEKAIFSTLPPLVKGYLRVGAGIGEGAVVDNQFNTTDVCIVLPTSRITDRYRKHYSRKLGRPLSGNADTEKVALTPVTPAPAALREEVLDKVPA